MGKPNLTDTLNDVDAYIAQQGKAIEHGEMLKRLIASTDFQEVILKGYIEVEAAKLFNILTDPSGKSPYTDTEITRKLASISDFKGYVGSEDFLGSVQMLAEAAPANIAREQDYRRNITAEAEDGE